jgi:hypothetical protein
MAEEKEDKREHAHDDSSEASKPKLKRLQLKKWLLPALGAVLAVVFAAGGYVYAVSPNPIRNPKMDHSHFRMQVVVDGQDVDTSDPAFQTPYTKGQCTADLATEPFHFHDDQGQFVHIHWAGMTGGLVLKNYGWNFVGGKDNILGYRTDELPRVKSVPIHGNALPYVAQNDTFWVYAGDENGYQKKSFEDFKAQPLEQFFGNESNFPKQTRADSIMAWLFPKASAHGSEHHHEAVLTVGDEAEAERLTRINNLLGNVIVFVQDSEPSEEQIRARFGNLAPLSDSTCGG